jgi:transposase-like protein
MKTQSEILALRRRIERERKAAGASRVRFSEGLRRDVVALAKRPGWSRDRVARALGLAPSLLYRWSTSPGGASAPKKKSRSKLSRVRVVAPSSVDLDGKLELEFRCGASGNRLFSKGRLDRGSSGNRLFSKGRLDRGSRRCVTFVPVGQQDQGHLVFLLASCGLNSASWPHNKTVHQTGAIPGRWKNPMRGRLACGARGSVGPLRKKKGPPPGGPFSFEPRLEPRYATPTLERFDVAAIAKDGL